MAHGNDMAGSIRIPASACGLVGLKPTRGRTSLGPNFGEFWGGLTHEGVLTRTVRDTASILDAISGPWSGDPHTAPPFSRPLAEEVGAPVEQLRIGVRSTVPIYGDAAHADCVAAVATVAQALDRLGHDLEPASPSALDASGGTEAGMLVLAAGMARDVERWAAITGDAIGSGDLEPASELVWRSTRALSAVDYLAAVEAMQQHARALSRWWTTGFDLLLLPTITEPPPEIGEVGPEAALREWPPERQMRMASFASPWNITGQPVVSLPMHCNGEGLPIGVQLVAAYGREDLLVRVASQLERALPWSDRLPPIRATAA